MAGEKVVALSTSKHIIIRTAWVFSEYGNNFVKTMLRLGRERDSLSIVADQYGCPTYAGDLADAILKLALDIERDCLWDKYGIYHFCGDEATSWHGFARAVFTEACEQGLLVNMPKIAPMATEAYPTPAKRPEYSVLDCSGLPIDNPHRNWQVSLAHVIQKFKNVKAGSGC